MKKQLLITAVIFTALNVKAQFLNYGIVGGVGFGGIEGQNLQVKSGINTEVGFLIKYNLTDKTSIKTFINFTGHKFTLSGGKYAQVDYSTGTYSVLNANDYIIRAPGLTQHIDFNYSIVEKILDVAGGLFWGGRFTNLSKTVGSPRIFYAATDQQILNQPNAPMCFETTSPDNTELYASDNIQRALTGGFAGAYISTLIGIERVKLLLRYDLTFKKFYANYSSTLTLKERYFRTGIVFILNTD